MAENSNLPNAENLNTKNGNFICGVVEGFYGRPWTTEQRKDLFQKMKKWGMDSYVYAPKDDYKHRAYWRELYTVEEAEHLSGLIQAAKDQNITFYYALSPGLDITYSSAKEITALKRKLEQVSQFGCMAFALLFDDIEPEMSEADKEVFQSFAQAQVSITNDIYQHLGQPRFLVCPTQYCSTRAVPNVTNSEYLNTLGSKLAQEIDIMWTGQKVISRTLTKENIQEITDVLRRPPVIWDNLHANDYDQKRVFLGPYSGRSPDLIPKLRGVVTNPNCEYGANFVAIHTLAQWSRCNADGQRDLTLNDAVSSDIKLETETEDGLPPDLPAALRLPPHTYHPRLALRNAISDWLPEFAKHKAAWGPITKPQPAVTVIPVAACPTAVTVAPLPIIPSINTCMTLTAATQTTTTTQAVVGGGGCNQGQQGLLTTAPGANTSTTSTTTVVVNQLHALAAEVVCPNVAIAGSLISPCPNPVMNSLVSDTKVICNESIPNPITPVPIPIPVVASSQDGSAPGTSEIKSINVLSGTLIKPVQLEKNSVCNKSNGKTLDAVGVANGDRNDAGNLEDQDGIICDRPHSHPDDPALNNELRIPIGQQQTAISSSSLIKEETCMNTDTSTDLSTESSLSPSEPMDCNSTPNISPAHHNLVLDKGAVIAGVVQVPGATVLVEGPTIAAATLGGGSSTHAGVCESSSEDVPMSEHSASSGSMQVEPADTTNQMVVENQVETERKENELTFEDLSLLCDLFYLPFEHGGQGLQLLQEFNWLKSNAHVVIAANQRKDTFKAEVQEWFSRAEKMNDMTEAVNRLFRHLSGCNNRELLYDLYSYLWDIRGVISLLNSYVKWLGFSKGWKETFMSGEQEPWVFRGGLTADLQRLIPVDSGNDLFVYKVPEVPTNRVYTVRPYNPSEDETHVYSLCQRLTCQNLDNNIPPPTSRQEEVYAEELKNLHGDRWVGPYLTLHPEFSFVVEDETGIVGYACASPDYKKFRLKMEMAWIPEMIERYPLSLVKDGAPKFVQESISYFHDFKDEIYVSSPTHPSSMICGILPSVSDQSVSKRLVTCLMAALRANGSFGVHVVMDSSDSYTHDFYGKLGFVENTHEAVKGKIVMGRTF